jgi:dihydrofolate reductase
MRELILKMSMSLDGFVSDLDGRNTWMFGADQEAKAWSVETLWNSGLHVMGSRTFEAMAGWWPTATDMFAPPMNQIPKAVFSRRWKGLPAGSGAASGERQPGAESWAEAYVASGDLAGEIGRMKAEDGKPVSAHGGVRFARSLISAGLVDEFILLVVPVALGKGMALFSDLAEPMSLRLVSSRAFPGGAVAQTYRPA